MKNNNQAAAEMFIKAIKTIAEKPQNLDNLETYLENHFSEWLYKYARTPVEIAVELKEFAEMEI